MYNYTVSVSVPTSIVLAKIVALTVIATTAIVATYKHHAKADENSASTKAQRSYAPDQPSA